MFPNKSKYSKRKRSKDLRNEFKQMNKEEIINNLSTTPIKGEPQQIVDAIEFSFIFTILVFLFIAIPSLFQIIVGNLNTQYTIPALFLFLIGIVGLYLITPIFSYRYIARRLYFSKNPQEELYQTLLKHGKITSGFVELTNLYSENRTLIRYSFSYKTSVLVQNYITTREVSIEQGEEIYVLYFRDIGSIPLI